MMTSLPLMDQDTLNRAGRAADRAVRAILDTQGALLEGDPHTARLCVDDANEAAQSLFLLLVGAGAVADGAPTPEPVPLELLDTPRTRKLLDALQYAVTCAQEVDEERGWVLADGSGCGLTDTVGDVYERLRQQVEGPRGKEN
jgi:hypothetical protein